MVWERPLPSPKREKMTASMGSGSMGVERQMDPREIWKVNSQGLGDGCVWGIGGEESRGAPGKIEMALLFVRQVAR